MSANKPKTHWTPHFSHHEYFIQDALQVRQGKIKIVRNNGMHLLLEIQH